MATEICVVFGDTHCGSTLGLCPPEGLELDDGGLYEPTAGQRFLWECWESAWAQVKKLARGKSLTLVANGDLCDNDHHRTAQLVSPLSGIHVSCAMECLRVPLALKPRDIHFIRGTPAHSGRSGGLENAIAASLRSSGWPVIKDPDTGQPSSYHRTLDYQGVRMSIAHHGRMGQRAHTRGSYSRLYGFDIWAEQMLDTYREMRVSDDPLEVFERRRPPDVAVRSHNHKYMDSGHDFRGVTRAVAVPAFQLATEWVYRIAAEALADIGLVVFIISDGNVEVRPILFLPSRSSPVTPREQKKK